MNRKTPFMLLGSMFVLMILLLGCTADAGSVTATHTPTVSPSPTRTPAPTEIPILVEGFVQIDKDNFRDIELIAELGAGKLYDTVVSPDGSTLATVTASGITLYDMETFEEIHHFTHLIFPASTAAYSSDGKYLVYTDHNVVIRIDIENLEWEVLFYLPGEESIVEMIDFTPDGNRIFIHNQYSSFRCDGPENYYSLFTLEGELLFSRNICDAYTGSFYHFNSDNTTSLEFVAMMTAAFPYELYRIDNKTGNVLAASYNREIEFGGEVVETIFGDKQLLPSGDEFPKTSEELYFLEPNDLLLHCGILLNRGYEYELFYNTDSFAILNPAISNTIVKMDIETCEIIQELQIPAAEDITFSPRDEFAITTNDFSTYVWQTINGNQVFAEEGVIQAYPINLAAFNQDGTYLLTSPYNNMDHNSELENFKNEVTVRDMRTFEVISKINIPDRSIYSFYETPFANIMVITDAYESRLWNIETGELISKIPKGQYISDEVHQQLWIFREETSYEYVPCIYDAQTGTLIREFEHIRSKNFAASLSEDASFMDFQYQSNEGYVYSRIDTDTGKEIWNEFVEFKTYSSRDLDNSLSGWTLGFPYLDRPILVVHEDGISSTKVLDIDGPLIVSDDLQFWDQESGAYLGKLFARYEVDSVIFSPHDYFMALLGEDGIARIYGVRDE